MKLFQIFLKHVPRFQKDMEDINRIKGYSNQKYNYVCVGSGPALYDIDFSCFREEGINLGQAPQTLHYSELLLEEYKDKFSPNAIIIIIIMCPFSFGDNLDVRKRWYSNKYYYLLTSERKKKIIKYNPVKSWAAKHDFPLFLYGTGFWYCLKKLFSTKKQASHINSFEEDIASLVRTWKREFGLENFSDTKQYKQHEEVATQKTNKLINLLQSLKTEGYRPICVVPPVNSKVRDAFTKDFLDVFFFNNLVKIKEIGFDVLNYFNVDFPDSLYKAPVFLNSDGAKQFSMQLVSELKRWLNE